MQDDLPGDIIGREEQWQVQRQSSPAWGGRPGALESGQTMYRYC